jgi:hypothetical protein
MGHTIYIFQFFKFIFLAAAKSISMFLLYNQILQTVNIIFSFSSKLFIFGAIFCISLSSKPFGK